MKFPNNRQSTTIIYIPPAHRPIRTLRFYRLVMLCIIFIITSACLTLYITQIRANFEATAKIHWLDSQINNERIEHRDMLATKDEIIERLQMDVFDLTEAAETIKKQMNELKQLEQEIRSLSSETDLDLDDQNDTVSRPDGLGGQTSPLNESFVQEWMEGTKETFVELEVDLNHLSELLSHAKDLLQEIDSVHRQTPSIWPTVSTTISSGFGIRKDPFTHKLTMHSGIDISGERHDHIFATAEGIVEQSGQDAVRGKYILIDHSHSIHTLYMHLDKILVNTGDQITKGEHIGLMGSTGRSTGPHLHYEVHKNEQPVNPKLYIK